MENVCLNGETRNHTGVFLEVFLRIGKIDISLNLAGLSGSPPFGIGTIRAAFQLDGSFPLLRDLLNRLVGLFAM